MNTIDTDSAIHSQEDFNPSPISEKPAPIGSRFFAAVIDRIILVIIGFLLNLLIRFDGGFALPIATSLLVDGIYAGYFYSKNGATPGKKAMGLKLVTSERKVNFIQGALRDTIGKWVSSIILMIGYIMALFREDGRALHDLMFDTKVVSTEK